MTLARNLLLYGALALTVAASVLDWDAGWLQSDAVTQATPQTARAEAPLLPRSRPHQAMGGIEPTVAPESGRALRIDPMSGNLFAVHSWLPPAPKQVAQAPRAPALPFKYLGQMVQDGETVVILDQASLTHLARKGQVIGSYRIEDIGARDMRFTYLPLSETQRLTFGTSP
jgi:hypothetical protein